MADGELEDDQTGQSHARMRDGLLAALTRQVGGAALTATPFTLLTVLSAAALAPLAAAEPAALPLATLTVAAGVGTNILSQVINDAITALRRRVAKPTPDDVEHDLSEHLERALTGAQAGQLRKQLAAVFQQIDVSGLALEFAIRSGDQAVLARLTECFRELGAEFAEFGFLLADLGRQATAIQQTLYRQDIEHRRDREQNAQQRMRLIHVQEQLAAISHRLGPAKSADATPWRDEAPYRGLLPFEQNHELIFHGREHTRNMLLNKLAERLEGPSLAVVTGASGVGKSSLLRAGLLPAVARGLLPGAPDCDKWPHLMLTPGHAPLDELAVGLAACGRLDPVTVRDILLSDPDQAHLLVRQALVATGQARLLIVVDQFEEVFTQVEDAHQRTAFITALATVSMVSHPPALVVIGVRSDFLDRLAALPELSEALHNGQFMVGPMLREELRRAIAGPAETAGVEIEGGLVEMILDDLAAQSDPRGALPLLSQAMLLTWENSAGGRLTSRDYGLSGGVARAVQTSAESVYEKLSPEQQETAREIFVRLVVVGHEGELARQRVDRQELAGDGAEKVLGAFTAKRLLVLDDQSVEIAHEAMLQAWPRLSDWLNEDLAEYVIYTALLKDARDWDARNRDSSFLYQGSRLSAVQQARARWEADPQRFPQLGGTAADFCRAGEQAAARRARRRRLSVTILSTLLVTTLIGLGGTTYLLYDARQEERKALSRQLAAQSESIGESDIGLSRRLSAAAWHLAETDEARYSMLRTLLNPARGTLDGSKDDMVVDGRVMHTPVSDLALSPDGTQLATTTGERAQLWDATTLKPLRTLPGRIEKIRYSPAGQRLATTQAGGTAQIWDVASSELVAVLHGHSQTINDMVFSPDGERLATASKDNTVRIWDAATGRALRSMGRHRGAVVSVRYSPDGRQLATAGYDKTVRLWNAATGASLAILRGHKAYVHEAIFSPTDDRLATAAADGVVHLWNTTTGKRTATLAATDSGRTPPAYRQAHTWATSTGQHVAFSPDGKRLVTAPAEGVARIWDPTTGKRLASLTGHIGSMSSVAVSPASTPLIATSDASTVKLWELGTGQLVATLPLMDLGQVEAGMPFGGADLVFNQYGNRLVTVSPDGTSTRLWDARIGQQTVPMTSLIQAMWTGFSSDGSRLAATSFHEAGLWDTASGKQISRVRPGHFNPSALVFSPDLSRMATASRDEEAARLWDTGSGKQIATLTGHTMPVHAAAFAPDGTRLATAGDDNNVRLWDGRTGRPTGVLQDTGRVGEVLFSPDGTRLAVVRRDRKVELWDPATRSRITTLQGRDIATGMVVAFSHDGKHLVTVGQGAKSGHVWDTTTGEKSLSFSGGGDAVRTVAFSPDDTLLATGRSDGGVRLSDARTGQQVAVLAGHAGATAAVAFSPDGELVATGSDDGTARLWDRHTGRELAVFPVADSRVETVAFSRDGRRLATGGTDNRLRIWEVGLPSGPFPAVCELAGGGLIRQEWAQYLPGEPYQDVCS